MAKIRELQPDLVTLDIEMPGMSGLDVLDELKAQNIKCGVVVVSALTKKGGKLTIDAIDKGAFDFVTKPEGDSIDESRKNLISSLTPLIKAFQRRLEIRNLLSATGTSSDPVSLPARLEQKESPRSEVDHDALNSISERMKRIGNNSLNRPEMVLIGVSTGGPNALAEMLPSLPANIGLPVFIVQHMPPLFTQPLAESLNSKCQIAVKEAENSEIAKANHAYIAPGGKHMRLKAELNNQIRIEITDDPPENNCRPAVDYLFRSAAHHFPGKSLAIILTGMGSDGLLGLKLLKRHGCFTIAQDESTCIVYGMPRAVVEAGLADEILPLSAIAGKITAAIKRL